jgi:hypothetical protein
MKLRLTSGGKRHDPRISAMLHKHVRAQRGSVPISTSPTGLRRRLERSAA